MTDPNTDKARKIIRDIRYITIATASKDAMPWNTPVFAAFDEDYNFFWGSNKDAQHSQNIRVNQNVFIVIYQSTQPAGDGVYLQAIAFELTDRKEIKKAYELLTKRASDYPWSIEDFFGDGHPRLYKAVPEKVWMYQASKKDGKFLDTRVEVNLLTQ